MGNKTKIAGVISVITLAGLAVFVQVGIVLAILVAILMSFGTFVFNMSFVWTDWLFWTVIPAIIITVVYGVLFGWILKD